MPRDGSGNYTLPSGNPVVPNTIISSSGWGNPTMTDIAAALTSSIAKDGQTTPTANLPMGNFRHTGVANAVARSDYAAAGQVQDGAMQWLTSVAGTDTITASIAVPPVTAYVAGQVFKFVSAGTNTTNAVTLNVNGIGAKSITKRGANALVAGDILNGQVVEVTYDGVRFQLQGISPGALLNVQVFTASGTYTPTPGMSTAVVEVQGGGGGGGGTQTTGAGQAAVAAGGSSGSYARSRLTAATIGASQTITIGAAGGFGGTNGNGGNGGTSSFGAIVSAPGGLGGSVGLASTPPFFQVPANPGSVATGGNIVNTTGIAAQIGQAIGSLTWSGAGGGSPIAYGGGGGPAVSANTAGQSGVARGAGGSGGALNAGQAATTGGAAVAGLIIVWEYA